MTPRGKTRLVGLTGGIGSGKSAVAELLSTKGAVIVDSDVLAREVVEPGTPGLAAIVARFGDQVLDGDGGLNRKALGVVVFADRAARRDLEAIVHPAVRQRAAELTEQAPGESVVVQVIPLLVETGQQDRFDHIIVVDLSPETQGYRITERDGPEQAEARMAAQASRDDRLAIADTVLNNDGTPVELSTQVDRWWSGHVPW